jgi:hypothetical protein
LDIQGLLFFQKSSDYFQFLFSVYNGSPS